MAGLSDHLQLLVEEAQQRTGIPGINVAVCVAGERATACRGTVARGSGVAISQDARFQLGCITKMLTSVVALELAHAGELSLEAPLAQYLPALSVTPGKQALQVRHLGCHTGGYQGVNPAEIESGYFYSWDKFTAFFARSCQVFTPGSTFNYEHTEGVLLGEVIRRVTGQHVHELFRQMLFDPLNLQIGSSTVDKLAPGLQVSDHSLDRVRKQYQVIRATPYCGFWAASLADMSCSAVDLLTLAEALAGIRQVSRISANTIAALPRQMISLPRMTGGLNQEALPRSFGFGCAKYGALWGHNGSTRGQTCALRFDPQRKIAIVVAMNAWQPHARDELVAAIERWVSPPTVQQDATLSNINPLSAVELPGTYVGCVPGVRIAIAADNDQLSCSVYGAASADKPTLRLIIACDPSGAFMMKSDAQHLSVGFFREAATGTPCIMLGLNAFKKVSC